MLPYRFKAGGSGVRTTDNKKMAAAVQSVHHHRSTTKTDHKPFKSRHATKSALKDAAKGKIEREDRGKRRTPHQQIMSKLVRRNQAKQARINHKEKLDHESSIFQGAGGAPKHIAIVPLSPDVDVRKAINQLNTGVDLEPNLEESGPVRVRVDRFKRNLLYLPATNDLLNSLDVCKLADWVVFVVKADQAIGPDEDMLLRSLEGQGITNVAVLVQDVDVTIPLNKSSKFFSDLKVGINHYFPSIEKILSLENKSDCANLVRSLCTASTKGIKWRDTRSWLLVEQMQWLQHVEGETMANVILDGVVRGKDLNPDRLVHVPGWGDFQIERILQPTHKLHNSKSDDMEMGEADKEWRSTNDRDDLAELAPDQSDMIDVANPVTASEQKGVLLDDHHYFSDDNSHIPEKPKKLPTGTSTYQAAWFLENVSDSDSDIMDDEEMSTSVPPEDLTAGPEDGNILMNEDAMTDVPATEYPESEMHMDADKEEEARQLQEYRDSRKNEAKDDLEFPDEIELHPDILARDRLAKYRGLKSLRTSEWNTAEDLPYQPSEYTRLLQIPEYKKSYSAAIKESLAGGVPAGKLVQVELRKVPLSFQNGIMPSSMFSLLRHEHKNTVVNLDIMLDSGFDEPIKSKEELIVQIGHRRLAINPVFSAASVTPNDVHKFDRFLHPGRTAVATFTGPLTWGAVPVLVFKRVSDNEATPELVGSNALDKLSSEQLQLIGSATTIPPSSTRVIAKRVVLTGHPYKVHKKLVTVRYMFFNREDVEWFKALPLWTKRGRHGFIKEPLGTHGYFKATFDGAGRVNGMDAIGVSLYKRVWPRPAKRLE